MLSFNWDTPQGCRSKSLMGTKQTLKQTMQQSVPSYRAGSILVSVCVLGAFCLLSGGISE